MPWTFESLSEAKPDRFEQILRSCPPPDYEQLVGFRYQGWNHSLAASLLSGEKFSKAFWRKGHRALGFNEVIHQSPGGVRGEWKRVMMGHRPVQLAFFKVNAVADEPDEPLYASYRHCGAFNYGLPKLNDGVNFIFRCIRDVVVLPNPGDHSLMLCKAHFRRSPRKADFYCYFLLGHRQPVDFPPW